MSQQPYYVYPNAYPSPGDVLEGKYRVDAIIGEGGMGAVAKATHILRRAPVALKFMSPAVLALQGALERFVNEGVAASQIDCENVVKVFDVGRLPSGTPYLVMEFLDGADLAQILERSGGSIDTTRAVHFALQALRALQMAHAAGIIHRDIKPSNCFVVDRDGEPDFVKLVDFGISKVRTDGAAASPQLTRTNSALGTPLYMAPEQARSPRDVDHRADLYSVGAILYQLLSGRTPYTADTGEYTEILYKIFTTDPAPLQSLRPDVSEGLATVIHRALAREPDARFATALDMADALAPFADERSATVLTRLRGGRGRSVLPPPRAPSVVPASVPSVPSVPSAPVISAAAVAQTAPGYLTQSGHLSGVDGVHTAIGVTREARTGTAPGRAPVALGVVALLVVLGAASLLVLWRSAPAPPHDSTATATATASNPPPPPPAASLAVASSATMTTPPASAPSAPPPAAPPVTPPASPQGKPSALPGSPGRPPSTLSGIQLH